MAHCTNTFPKEIWSIAGIKAIYLRLYCHDVQNSIKIYKTHKKIKRKTIHGEETKPLTEADSEMTQIWNLK